MRADTALTASSLPPPLPGAKGVGALQMDVYAMGRGALLPRARQMQGLRESGGTATVQGKMCGQRSF